MVEMGIDIFQGVVFAKQGGGRFGADTFCSGDIVGYITAECQKLGKEFRRNSELFNNLFFAEQFKLILVFGGFQDFNSIVNQLGKIFVRGDNVNLA